MVRPVWPWPYQFLREKNGVALIALKYGHRKLRSLDSLVVTLDVEDSKK